MDGLMSDPRSSAISFEAIKVSMRQSKDGVMVTFAIHPNDQTNDLLIHPVGSRYQVALVQLDDEGQPIEPRSRSEGKHAVEASGMLCKSMEFQSWLYRTGAILQATEEDAVQYIHSYCGVASRSQIGDNVEARRLFDALRLRFNQSRSIL